MKKIVSACSFAFASIFLAACGGGGANIGVTTPTQLQVSPASLILTGASGKCPSGTVNVNFYVTGGQPPYSIKPAQPSVTILNTTTVGADGGFFTVTQLVNPSCPLDTFIAVEDQTGAVVQAELKTGPGI